jgi:hypothetical protein
LEIHPKGGIKVKNNIVDAGKVNVDLTRGNFIKSQKNRNLVIISNAETIKDLKEIQEIFYNNQGIQLSLQKVVDHLIHHYLRER